MVINESMTLKTDFKLKFCEAEIFCSLFENCIKIGIMGRRLVLKLNTKKISLRIKIKEKNTKLPASWNTSVGSDLDRLIFINRFRL